MWSQINSISRKSDLKAVMVGDLSFWCAFVFVLAGIIYVINEILLGERVSTETDVSWRLNEVLVWTGFTIGIFGYFRVFLKSVQHDCFDNKDQIVAFQRSILHETALNLAKSKEMLTRRHIVSDFDLISSSSENEADAVLLDTFNPVTNVKGIAKTVGGVVETR